MSNLPQFVRLDRSYDPVLLLKDLNIAMEFGQVAQPFDYHNGEWRGTSLYSQGGDGKTAFAGSIGLDPFRETEVVRATPYFRKILSELNVPKRSVRLLTLAPGGEILPHRDSNIGFGIGQLRLHLPISSNPDVEFNIDGMKCPAGVGELWFSDVARSHWVKNEGVTPRTHLVIDVEINEFLLNLFPREYAAKIRMGEICLHRPSVELSDQTLRSHECILLLPAMIFKVIRFSLDSAKAAREGRQSASRVGAGGAVDDVPVHLHAEEGTLIGRVGKEKIMRLQPTGDGLFTICGMPPAFSLRLTPSDEPCVRAVLNLPGNVQFPLKTVLDALS